jgi:hypothetical protein
MPTYIVIQNGEPYPNAYQTYNLAVEHVKLRNADMLEEANGCNDIDVVENSDGKTYLYIEKGIHIYIHKLSVIYTY